MRYFIDFASGSLIKYGEELCGDNVEFYVDNDMSVAVLSDGLSSGVKANILATLTSTIALTMIKNGLTIGNQARINMGAVVSLDVAEHEAVTGNFAIEHRKFIENMKKSIT